MTIQLKNRTLRWLSELGYWVGFGPCTVRDGPTLKRVESFPFRLREDIQRFNPNVPNAESQDALQRMQDSGLVTLSSSMGRGAGCTDSAEHWSAGV